MSPETKGVILPRYHSGLPPLEATHSNRYNGRIPKALYSAPQTHGRPSGASAAEGLQPATLLLYQRATPYSSRSLSLLVNGTIISCDRLGVKKLTAPRDGGMNRFVVSCV